MDFKNILKGDLVGHEFHGNQFSNKPGSGNSPGEHLKMVNAHRNANTFHYMGSHEFHGQDAGALHATAADANMKAWQLHQAAITQSTDPYLAARATQATKDAAAASKAAIASTPSYQPKAKK